jgi:hypothetical protein
MLEPQIRTRVAVIRRRRRLVGVTAVAIAVAAVVATPTAFDRRKGGDGTDPARLPVVSTTTSAPVRQVPLSDLLATTRSKTIPTELPGGERFTPEAVGSDGTVLGTSQTLDGRASGVWLVGPDDAKPRRVNQFAAKSPWMMAVGDHSLLWPNGEWLECLTRGEQSKVRVLDKEWGGRQRFFADGRSIVWTRTDGLDQGLVVAEGCTGPGKVLPVSGEIMAFSNPLAIVIGEEGVREVNVNTGVVRLIPGAPQPNPDNLANIAVGSDYLAWIIGPDIEIVDQKTQTVRKIKLDLPKATKDKFDFSVTGGRRLLIYSASHNDTEEGYSIVYDTKTGRAASISSPVRGVGGDWVLWQDGSGSSLARAR